METSFLWNKVVVRLQVSNLWIEWLCVCCVSSVCWENWSVPTSDYVYNKERNSYSLNSLSTPCKPFNTVRFQLCKGKNDTNPLYLIGLGENWHKIDLHMCICLYQAFLTSRHLWLNSQTLMMFESILMFPCLGRHYWWKIKTFNQKTWLIHCSTLKCWSQILFWEREQVAILTLICSGED